MNDTNQNHKFVTESEKNQITTNKNNIENLKKTKQDNLTAGKNMTIVNNVINTTASRVYGNVTNETTKNLINIQIEDTVYKIPVYGLTIYTPRYDITTNLTNVNASTSNPTTIISGGTASLTFIPNTGYSLPEIINVTGATSQWSQSSGILKLIEPVDDIVITIVGNETTPTLKAGTYKWSDFLDFDISSSITQNLSFTCLGSDIVYSSLDFHKAPPYFSYFTGPRDETLVYSEDGWVNNNYQTIILSTDQQVDRTFLDWAITQGNLVYQGANGTKQ